MRLRTFMTLWLLFIARGTCLSAVHPVDINVEVFQTLREGVKGVDFDNDIVRVGLPFPQGVVRNVKGRPALSAEGKEFQGRVLEQWSDGSVKWALIEFLASVGKGKSETVRVIEGAGASSGRDLASEKAGTVTVDTGPMQIEIGKKGFSIFDRVVVNSKELVKRGASRGIVLMDGTGKEFLASQCSDTRIAIEENGPIESIVRIDGGHCIGSERLLDYTMRLYFCKGQSRVKAQYTLRNASKKNPRHVFIKSLNMETALNIGEGKKAIVATHKGEKEFDLKKGSIGFYQAVSDFPWLSDGDSFYYHGPVEPDYAREKQRGYSQEGYWLKQDGKAVEDGKRNQVVDLGFIDVSDSASFGMTAGIRYLAGQWPKALKADGTGKTTVSLWPEENGKGYWIRYGSHTTFEVMFFFHDKRSPVPDLEMKRFQYPLMGRAPISWYNRNVEGIYPLYHFISFSDEKRLADKLGTPYAVGWRKPKFKIWRYHYWGHGAFLNQHDFARIALVNALRDDRSLGSAGESYLAAEAAFNYYADWSVYHSDDYDYSKTQFDPKEHRGEADLSKVIFEWEHQHWYGMPLYYYMTGDERVRDAVEDWGEYVKKGSSPLRLNHMRVYGTGMFSLAAMYDFTHDNEYMKLADMNFQRLLNAPFNKSNPYTNIFIDWDRGFVAGGSGSGWEDNNPGVKADLMLGSILYDGLLNYYQHMKSGNPNQDKCRLLLMKISDFMLREAYFEGTKGKSEKWAFWIPYILNLNDREKSRHSYKLIGQATFWTVFPYEATGKEIWLEQMKKMMKMALWDESGVWGSYGYIDHPGFQAIGYHLLRNFYPDLHR
ncbi:MAG: hypothetical protein ED859_07430 [Desulfuromonadales bacterium]|nr:MAG: hypothetical protein ED859_07430 [Desulfuromonadales bacterium]